MFPHTCVLDTARVDVLTIVCDIADKVHTQSTWLLSGHLHLTVLYTIVTSAEIKLSEFGIISSTFIIVLTS